MDIIIKENGNIMEEHWLYPWVLLVLQNGLLCHYAAIMMQRSTHQT